jgi:flagellar motor switch protein FliN/FliY
MTPGEAQAMQDVSETGASDFEQTFAGMAAEAEFSGELAEAAGETGTASTIDQPDNSALIAGLPVMMKVVLGSAKMPVATLAKLAKGSVVKLDKMVGDPVDILVNGRLIARGEVVVLNEGSSRFGVVLTQVGGLAPSAK